MTELLTIKETMSSLEIASITGKQHAHVMRDIRSLLEHGVHESNFGLMYIINKLGNGAERKDPYYELTKKGCLILASGYDAKLREKIIDRWEELEMEKQAKQPHEPTRKELAMMVLQAEEEKERLALENQRQQETIELQQAEIKKSAPKVEYYDKTLQSVNTQTTTQVAKSLGMDAQKLNRKLKEAGILYNQSGQWLLKQPYASWGLHATRTQTYTRSDGSTGTSTYTVWTEKGKRFIHALNDNGFDTKKAVKQIKGETVSVA